MPNLYNLRSDPFERGPTSIYYPDWLVRRVFIQVPIQAYVAQWLASFKELPPRQKPASFNLDNVMQKPMSKQGGNDWMRKPASTSWCFGSQRWLDAYHFG